MFTTYDRHLLQRFLQAFAVLFTASLGLFAVVDGFLNLDEFQKASGDHGVLAMLGAMGRHYAVQSTMLLDMLGPTLAVLAALIVLALVLKHGELHPLLAAGVSTYRATAPLILGVLLINAGLAANQELLIPRIAAVLQSGDVDAGDAQAIESQFDVQTWIFVSAESIRLSEQTLTRPEFRLPSPQLVREPQTISGAAARYFAPQGGHPGGWLVRRPAPTWEQLSLTDAGRKVVLRQPKTGDLFVVSRLSADQLFNRGTSFRYLSTTELLGRIREPAASDSSVRTQIMHLHERLTRPLLTVIGVLLVVPLVARREQMNLAPNIFTCMLVLGAVYGLWLGGQLLGQAAVVKPEFAAWAPLVVGGALCAWLTETART